MSKDIQKIDGETSVGLLFHGTRAPYFGRGAVKELKLEYDGYSGEFSIYSTNLKRGDKGTLLAKSTKQVLRATDFSLDERMLSFSKTKLPYGTHGVSAENYINLNAYERLVVEIEDVNESDCTGFIKQEWSQLVYDKNTPVVRFPFNLTVDVEYIPPQVRKERAEAEAKKAAAAAEVTA